MDDDLPDVAMQAEPILYLMQLRKKKGDLPLRK